MPTYSKLSVPESSAEATMADVAPPAVDMNRDTDPDTENLNSAIHGDRDLADDTTEDETEDADDDAIKGATEYEHDDAEETEDDEGSSDLATTGTTTAVEGPITTPDVDCLPAFHYAVLDYMYGGRSHDKPSAAELEWKANRLLTIDPRAHSYPDALITWFVHLTGLELIDSWNLRLVFSAHLLTFDELRTVQPGHWKSGTAVDKLVARSVERVFAWKHARIEAVKQADRERGFVWWLPGQTVPMLKTPQPGSLRDRRHVEAKRRSQRDADNKPTPHGNVIVPYVTHTTDPNIYPKEVISAIAAANCLAVAGRAPQMLRNILAAYHVDPVSLCNSRYEKMHEYEWDLTRTEAILLMALRATYVAQQQYEFSETPIRRKGDTTIKYRGDLVPVLQQAAGLWSRRREGVKAEVLEGKRFRAWEGVGAEAVKDR